MEDYPNLFDNKIFIEILAGVIIFMVSFFIMYDGFVFGAVIRSVIVTVIIMIAYNVSKTNGKD